jgi:alanyl-tRNA synthetase
MIAKFIHEAVDRVIASRAEAITKEERKRIVEQTQSRIEDLTRQRSQVEGSLLEQIESFKTRIAELEKSLAQARAGADNVAASRLTETVKEKEREVEVLRRELSDRDRQIGELNQKLHEASSHRGSPAVEGLIVALLNKFNEQAQAQPNQNFAQLQASIEGIAERISRLGSVGGGGGAEIVDKEVIIERLFARDTGEAMESNVGEVKVKQARSRGVKNTLSKLKALQQGGSKDGEQS